MKISKSQIFLYSCVSIVLGVGVGSFIPEKILSYHLIWFCALIIGFVLFPFLSKKKFVYCLFIICVILGVWRYAITFPINNPENIKYYNGKKIELTGIVQKETITKDGKQKIVLGGLKKQYKIQGRILMHADSFPKYNYGDLLWVKCRLVEPKEYNGFSYDRYLALDKIYSLCYYPQIEKRGESASFAIKKIYEIKDSVRNRIEIGLEEPGASLIKAVILGDKSGIPNNIREQFSRIGLSHIIAISGMHISVIVGMLMVIFINIGIKRKIAFYFISVFLVLYIILVGAPSSAVRAGLMGFMVLLALYLGRINKLINSLVFIAAIILLINPRLLRDDIGFQLSFLSVLGIITWYPAISSWVKDNYLSRLKILKKFTKAVTDILLITIIVQIFILPIIVYNFSIVSIISPFANLFVLWTLAFLIPLSVMAITLSLVLPQFSIIFFFPVHVIWSYIFFVSNVLGGIKFSFFEINFSNFLFIILYYGCLLVATRIIMKKVKL